MIPEIYEKDNKKYYLVKKYPNFVLYQLPNGLAECFSYHELGLIEETAEPYRKSYNDGIIMF